MYSLPGTLSQKQKQGTALVLVLSCLALLSILAVAFISSVSTEVETSSRYADSADVKQISQTAVNMIIAQIQQATSNGDVAWSSQPGLIRTYDNTGASGPAYKLYSTENMIVDPAFDPNARVDIPVDWKDRPAEFVDLNQPILRPEASGNIVKDGVSYTPSYPILDPGSLGQIKGFSIDDQEVPPDYSLIDPTINNPAAMPVRWLYLLEDGSFRIPDADGNIAGATKKNPPIARVAFWTDDETCKVNINTAAGDEWANTTDPGSFMDIPRARSAFDERLASTQPVSHEYQRYPGHPASTYLSAVFPSLTRAQIGDIIPRVAAGGSNGGSKTTSGIDPVSGADITGPALPFSDGLPLYASVDELRYVRSNTARGQAPLFTPRKIEESKFFLTAQSRAPELNLLNRPRVSLWPEPATAANRTSFDKTIAFCSTVAGDPYYFVRNDATSATADYASQPRNQELYAYLQQVTSTPVPGFGGDFLSKYPSPPSRQTSGAGSNSY